MFGDLDLFFYNGVVEAYDAYATSRDSDTSGRNRHSRLAVEAATALFHFREHFPPEHIKTRSRVVSECPEYRLIADVVNAAKHRLLTKSTSEGPPLVASAEDIQEVTIVTRYEDEAGEYPDARTVIMIECSDGVSRSLDNALTVVLNYWGDELKRLGLADYRPRAVPEMPGSRFVPREDARPLNLEMVQGLGWKQTFRLLKFNAEAGFAEPIDLTGSEVSFSIYNKAAMTLNVTLTSPDGSTKVAIPVELSEEESAEFNSLKAKTEQDTFVRSMLIKRQEDVRRAISEATTARTGEGQGAQGDGCSTP